MASERARPRLVPPEAPRYQPSRKSRLLQSLANWLLESVYAMDSVMATFLNRYLAGECVAVWRKLAALGEEARHRRYYEDVEIFVVYDVTSAEREPSLIATSMEWVRSEIREPRYRSASA